MMKEQLYKDVKLMMLCRHCDLMSFFMHMQNAHVLAQLVILPT